jgi:hypothetical protein
MHIFCLYMHYFGEMIFSSGRRSCNVCVCVCMCMYVLMSAMCAMRVWTYVLYVYVHYATA